MSLEEILGGIGNEAAGEILFIDEETEIKVNFDGSFMIYGADGEQTKFDPASRFLITRDVDGNFLDERPLNYLDLLKLKMAFDQFMEGKEPEYAEFNPLDELDYFENKQDGTVTIYWEDGSSIEIDTKTLRSTEYDAYGIPSAPKTITQVLKEEVPQEIYSIPIPYSDHENIKIMDGGASLEVYDYLDEVTTTVDLLSLVMTTVDNSTGDVVHTDKLTWDLVIIFLEQANRFYDELYGEEEDDEDCDWTTEGNFVCFSEYDMFTIMPDFTYKVESPSGDEVFEEGTVADKFMMLSEEISYGYIDWQLWSMGMIINEISPDTGNVTLTNPENGQIYTIDHSA